MSRSLDNVAAPMILTSNGGVSTAVPGAARSNNENDNAAVAEDLLFSAAVGLLTTPTLLIN